MQAKIHEAEQDSGAFVANPPRCFGAASRDPLRPCENADLRRKVVPAPVAAKT